MKKRIIFLSLCLSVLALVVFFEKFSPAEVEAQLPQQGIYCPPDCPPLHVGLNSPGQTIDEATNEENPLIFLEGKVDWPILGISECRTAWECVQQGMWYQDDLEDPHTALEYYVHAEELLHEIAEEKNDPTLPERLLILHRRLGNLYIELGRHEDAIHEFEIVLHESPENVRPRHPGQVAASHRADFAVHLRLALAFTELDDFEHAFEHYELALLATPRWQLANFDFARFLMREDVHLEHVDQHEREELALHSLEMYLDEAKSHCDAYPHRILEAIDRARQLGAPAAIGQEAVAACFPYPDRILEMDELDN